ncbi:MAG: methyltransferase [Candidatus Binataceae bacterium]
MKRLLRQIEEEKVELEIGDAILKQLVGTATMVTTTHPETELVPYLRGELQGAQRERIAHHLKHCARCRELVASFAAGMRELSLRIEIPAPDWALSDAAALPSGARTPAFKLLGGVALNVAIFGVLLLAPAGTLQWWHAWFFLVVVLVCSVATMFGVFRRREELLDERLKPPIQKQQPLSDKFVLTASLASFGGLIVLIPLDVFHFHLIGAPSEAISSLGLILFVAGWIIVSLAFRENAFAAPVVKNQAERHHVVIDTGVYRIVRHPMYAGALPLIVGMPLWLQSYAAAAFAIVPIMLLVVRITFEERFLTRELKGYAEYTRRVRYRLIPFLW